MFSHPCPTLSQTPTMVPQAEMFTGLIILEAIVKIISAISIALGVQVQLVGSERCCEHGIWSLILSPEQVGSLPLCAVEAVEQKPSSASQSGGYQLECWGEGLWGRRWGGVLRCGGWGGSKRDLPCPDSCGSFRAQRRLAHLVSSQGRSLQGLCSHAQQPSFFCVCLPQCISFLLPKRRDSDRLGCSGI